LATRQSQLVADALMRLHPGLRVELVIIQTSGDRITDRPLYEEGGKGLFIRELELALLEERIDLAVHSYKDVPVTMPLVSQEKLTIAAVPPRAQPWDVLVSRSAKSLDQLPSGARVGTGSLRRKYQILAQFTSLAVEPIRGNIDTRLKKCADGQVDALILAKAGLERAGLYDESYMTPLAADEMLPAAGQGALALQCRLNDHRTQDQVAVLHDPPTEQCVSAERALVGLLRGDCRSPIAALGEPEESHLRLRAAVCGEGADGRITVMHAEGRGDAPAAAAEAVFQSLRDQGAESLLRGGQA
jgi:hydroxymethylbilane synthase